MRINDILIVDVSDRKEKQGTPVFYTYKAGDASPELPKVDPSLSEGGSLRKLVKELAMPIHLLPDVRDFKVKVNKMDWLFDLFGIVKRVSPDISFKPYKNRKMNRFIVHQMIRLSKARRNPKLYWAISRRLLASVAFNVSALQHVKPGWHRVMPYHSVLKVMSRVNDMVKSRATNVEFYRVYIDKPGSVIGRPLGVPTLEWRIYLHMWNVLLTWLVKPLISGSQHAYQPGKGVITAWAEVAEKVLRARDIWEFDLKNFFGSVKVDYILTEMYKEKKLTLDVARELKGILSSLPHTYLVDEEEETGKSGLYPSKLVKKAWKLEIDSVSRFEDVWVRSRRNFLKGQPRYDDVLPFREAETDQEREQVAEYKRKYKLDPFFLVSRGPSSSPVGVPQGAPISPITSLVALEEAMFGKRKLMAKYLGQDEFNTITHGATQSGCFTYPFEMHTVMYADDGIRYGEFLPNLPVQGEGYLGQHEAFYEPLRSSGIEFNFNKSGWVKRSGEWLRPLKFLGMVYDPFSNVFKSQTRKGNSLEFQESEQFLSWLNENRDLARGSASENAVKPLDSWLDKRLRKWLMLDASWTELFTEKAKGFIFSRLQAGDWNLTFKQDFTLNFVKKSWMEIKAIRWIRWTERYTGSITVFNSSSFAVQCLAEDLARKRSYRRRTAYLASLQFGKRAALQKIRRVLWGGRYMLPTENSPPVTSWSEKEQRLSLMVSALEEEVNRTAFNLAMIQRGRRLLKVRRVLEYDMVVTRRKYYSLLLLSLSRWVQDQRTLLAEITSLEYSDAPGLIERMMLWIHQRRD